MMGSFVAIGAVCGYLAASYADNFAAGESFLKKMSGYIVILAELGAAVYLQIIFHEAGHLAAGLLTGYHFASFRIGSFIWVKEEKKIKLKRLSLAGTGGQCLMNPPDMVGGKIPFVFYNLGGSLMNLAVAAVSFGVYFGYSGNLYVTAFCLFMGIIGTAYALINGIPIHTDLIDNDGYNAKSLGKNPEALFAFWIQMKVMEMTARGIRLKDMPEEWFYIPDENGMKNSMIATMAVFYENRLMDRGEIQEAESLITRLLSEKNAVVGVYRLLLTCDRIVCELLDGADKNIIEKLYSKELQKFMKQMKKFPSVIRTEYAYMLLYKQNKNDADKIKERFRKCAKTHPYVTDIESEQELINLIDLNAEHRGIQKIPNKVQ